MIPDGLNNILNGRDDGDEVTLVHQVLDAHRKVFEKRGGQWRFLKYLVSARANGWSLDEDSIGRALYRDDYNFKLHNNVRQTKHDCVETLEDYYGGQGTGERCRLAFVGYVLSVRSHDPTAEMTRRKSIAVRFPLNPWAGIVGGEWSEIMLGLARLAQTELVKALTDDGSFDVHCVSGPHARIGRDYTVHLLLQERNRAEGRLTYAVERRGQHEIVKGESDDVDCKRVIPLAHDLAGRVLSAIRNEQHTLPKSHRSAVITHDVFEACRRGFDQLALRTPAGIKRAIELFEDVLNREESCALAYSGLSWCYSLHTWYFGVNGCDCHLRALDLAEKGLQIDSRLPEAHVARAYAILLVRHDVVAAEAGFRTAIGLNSECAQAHHWLGNVLNMMGRFAEAKQSLERAFALSPAQAVLAKCLGDHAFYANDYIEAARVYKSALQHHGAFWQLRLFLAWTLIFLGEYKEAELHIAAARDCEAARSLVDGCIGMLYAASGNRSEALRIAAGMERAFEVDKTVPHSLAAVYSMLGDLDDAVRWLTIAEKHPVEHLLFLGVDPRFARLRDDSRFQALLLRLGVRPAVAARS